MRYLGLDLGTKTLGIALSDETLTIATSYKTIRYEDKNNLITDIKKIVNEFSISKIILGYPKNMNNTIGDRAIITMEFKDKLEQELKIEIQLQDERLSTVSAHKYMIEADLSRKKRKTKIDSLAATIILQTYLDKERNNKI